MKAKFVNASHHQDLIGETVYFNGDEESLKLLFGESVQMQEPFRVIDEDRDRYKNEYGYPIRLLHVSTQEQNGFVTAWVNAERFTVEERTP